MPTSPTGHPDTKRLEAYFLIVQHAIAECADTRCGPLDVFLWHARRLAEAALCAVAEGTEHAASLRASPSRSVDFGELAKELAAAGRIPEELLVPLEVLRAVGGVSAHSPVAEVVADPTLAKAAQAAAVEVALWLFHESEVRRPTSEGLRAELQELASERLKPSRNDRIAMELRQARAELEDLKAPLTVARPASDDGANPGRTAGSFSWRAASIAAAVGFLACAAVWMISRAAGSGPQVPAAACAPCPPCAAAADPVAAAAPATAAEAAAPEISPDAEAPAATTATEDAGATADQAAEAAPGDGDCPPGAQLVPGRTLRWAQGPSPRPSWPEPATPRPAPTRVGSYCIDSRAAREADLAAAALPDECARGPASAEASGGENPARSVHWSCAQAYCQGRGGTLPSIGQWELAVRSLGDLQLEPGAGEWAADAWPFEVFGYGPPPVAGEPGRHAFWPRPIEPRPQGKKPWLSWGRSDRGDRGNGSVGLRCVWPKENP